MVKATVKRKYQEHILARSLQKEESPDKEELAQCVKAEVMHKYQRKKTFDKINKNFQHLIQNKYEVEQKLKYDKNI